MTWHIDGDTWDGFAAGTLNYAAQAAVETHLAGCGHCQAQAAARDTSAADIWARVRSEITRHRAPWSLRWLRRLGVSDEDIVIVSASGNLRLPWAVAVGGALATVIIAANLGRFEDMGFLLIGPMVPALAVLAAYDSTDPLRQITTSTPYSKLRLALLRTFATLMVALPVMIGLSATIPGLRGLTWVWLLPSIVLTAASLTVLRWLPTWQTGGLIAVTWAVTVFTMTGTGRLDHLSSVGGQVAFALVAALGIAAVALTHTGPRIVRGRP